jgi:hypothetical protein
MVEKIFLTFFTILLDKNAEMGYNDGRLKKRIEENQWESSSGLGLMPSPLRLTGCRGERITL